jgi:hypothetical protein
VLCLLSVASGDVVDVVLAEIWSMPRHGAVVSIIVQNGQAMMSRSGCDHQIHCRGAVVLSRSSHLMLNRGDPAPRVLRHGHIRVQVREHLGDLVVFSGASGRVQELRSLRVAGGDGLGIQGVIPGFLQGGITEQADEPGSIEQVYQRISFSARCRRSASSIAPQCCARSKCRAMRAARSCFSA